MMIEKEELEKMVEKAIIEGKMSEKKLGNDVYNVRPGVIAVIRLHYDPVLEMQLTRAHRRVEYKYVRRQGKAIFDIDEIYKQVKKAYKENEEEEREIEEL
ncbi:MAG: hypothetical protein H5T41_09905 [Methanomassiliicoccales archaeon]|nr:hypothetical protein [Methanomassiliicoccales archaeon]